MATNSRPPIIAISKAIAAGMSAAQFEAIAAWHDDKAELAQRPADRLRHEVLSYRLARCAQAMRVWRKAAA